MEEELENGLIVGHAYSVTDARTVCVEFRLLCNKLTRHRQILCLINQCVEINSYASPHYIMYHPGEFSSSKYWLIFIFFTCACNSKLAVKIIEISLRTLSCQ